MQLPRRSVLTTTGALIAAIGAGTRLSQAFADGLAVASDPRMADRAAGDKSAGIVVEEWFSFTCHFCAGFKANVYPEVKAKLIDTGKLRFVFHEYPRDQIDLVAAMVARSLPADRYEPFMDTLLATQSHWAFDRSVDPRTELAKMAALAGMPREMFEQVASDDTLKSEILAAQAKVERTYNINATPTFILNGQTHTGEPGLNFQAFARMLSS